MVDLYWLPHLPDWRARTALLTSAGEDGWRTAVSLANANLNFTSTNMLDSTLRKALANSPLPAAQGKPVRLALLGSCTLSHLHPAIRVAGLRRDIPIEVYENNFGQYWQELSDTTSDLYAFGPTMVLFALDGRHLAAGVEAGFDDTAAASALTEMKLRLRTCWRMAREAFHCPIIQQTALPVHLPLMGGNEHRLHGSAAHFIFRLNHELRAMADEEGVEILALDALAARNGIKAWHDVELWHRAKQEIAPRAAPAYGEAVGRVIAAAQGRSAKCLVLDLDNTLWGGVIGDDGMDGIVLGQGSALGEAFVAFQAYAKDLMRRGVILAVCSKNDEVNAVEPFDDHPEMVLRRSDIACFVANWQDKATNIRTIAEQLNIGLDSIVFVDDNPFERALVRQELPMVMTPEVGEDPATYAETLADAGYFESLVITDDDRARSAQYQGNLRRAALQAASTDLPSYLRGLEMRLLWRPFDAIGLSRTVQLINKTNQFNLTTRRYTEDDVLSIMADRRAFGLQLRLLDRFGDNGVIAIVVGRLISETDMLIDTWLMSCRVLGRQVESTTLNLIAAQARTLGATRLVGIYVPTKKNGMVKDHYARLGFSMVAADPSGASRGVLDLARFTPADTFIDVCEG